MEALSDLVASDPERFPMGLLSLGDGERGQWRVQPLVDADGIVDGGVVERVRQAIERLPALRGRLVSRDGQLTLVAAIFDDRDPSFAALEAVVDQVDAWLDAHPPPTGIRVYRGGLPHLRTTLVRYMRADQARLIPGTLLVCLIALGMAFRWLPGLLLPLVAVTLTALWVLGGMALFGEPLNVINNSLPALLIIIGISDSIHLVGRYREEIAASGDRRLAVRATVCSMGGACLFTSLTTAAGLFSLIVSRTQMLRGFGVVAAIGVMLAYLVTVLFLPAALLRCRTPRVEAVDPSRFALRPQLTWLTRGVIGRPRRVLLVSALLALGGVVLGQQVQVDSRLLDQFDSSDPTFQTTRLLESQFEGVRPLDLILSRPSPGRVDEPALLRALAGVQRWAAEQPCVLATRSPVDLYRQAWSMLTDQPASVAQVTRSADQVSAFGRLLGARERAPLDSHLAADGRVMRIGVRLADCGSRATLELAAKLRARVVGATGPWADLRIDFAGDAYTSSHGLDAVVGDLLGSLGLAVVVIFVMLSLLFRSLKLGLVSIPPNLLPLILLFAWMGLRGIPLNAATAILFAISIGLAVDGSIHLLSRFIEERRLGQGLDDALLRSARGTGRAIVISCLTLIAGFSVLLLSRFVPVQRFAELIAVSVAGCLVSTLVVQPALLKLWLRPGPEQALADAEHDA